MRVHWAPPDLALRVCRISILRSASICDNEERFSLGGAAHRPPRECSAVGGRAGERKTDWTKPLPPPGLWVLNTPGCFAGAPSGHAGRGGRERFVAATRHRSDQNSRDLTVWPRFRHASGPDGHNIPTPVWRAVRLHAIGTSILGHDVSGTGQQTLGLAMQSITTMMPVWQCGHSRKDRPVSAS